MPYKYIRHDSRHPFEWVLLLTVFCYAIIQAVFDIFPGAINTNVSGVWQYAWGILLMLGTGSSLWGIAMRRETTGLALERGGMVFAGGATLIYSFALFSTGLATAWLAGSFFGAFSVACFLRSFIIRRDMREVAKGNFKFIKVEAPVIGSLPDRSEEGGDIR